MPSRSYDSDGKREGRDQYGSGDPHANKINGKDIVAVKRSEDGEITDFQLNDGTVVSYQQAIDAYEQGQVQGLALQDVQGDRRAFRSLPDGVSSNNLQNLPDFN